MCDRHSNQFVKAVKFTEEEAYIRFIWRFKTIGTVQHYRHIKLPDQADLANSVRVVAREVLPTKVSTFLILEQTCP